MGIVGTSGSGKSTIVKLIERFYDPYSGTVKMGGHLIQDIRLASLRKSIGLVSQTPILFNSTIRNNLTYACEEGALPSD